MKFFGKRASAFADNVYAQPINMVCDADPKSVDPREKFSSGTVRLSSTCRQWFHLGNGKLGEGFQDKEMSQMLLIV